MRFLGRHARRIPAASVLAVLAFTLFSACNKEEKKPVPQEERKASAVPSGVVFNDFLPNSGSGQGLAVKGLDGGFEAGLGENAGGAESANGTEAAETPGAAKIDVLEPGAEPRAVRKYTFVANRVERRTLTIRQSIAAKDQAQSLPGLVMTIDVVAKEVKPAGAHFEMKLVKIDLADKDKLDPRLVQSASQQFAGLSGLSATFDINPHGEIGEMSLSGNEKMQREGAEELLGALAQFVELVVPPLPATAIGQGAKWERTETMNDRGLAQQSKRTLELKDVSDTGGTISSAMEKKIPKHEYPDPRMPGATMELDGSGTATYTFRFDRVASKVVSEQTQRVKIEAPAGPDPKAEKKTVAQEITVKHLLETPPGK